MGSHSLMPKLLRRLARGRAHVCVYVCVCTHVCSLEKVGEAQLMSHRPATAQGSPTVSLGVLLPSPSNGPTCLRQGPCWVDPGQHEARTLGALEWSLSGSRENGAWCPRALWGPTGPVHSRPNGATSWDSGGRVFRPLPGCGHLFSEGKATGALSVRKFSLRVVSGAQ